MINEQLKARIAKIQERLDAHGVKDIKFVYAPGQHLPSEVAEDMCDMLEAYLDGNYHPLPKLGDSVRDK